VYLGNLILPVSVLRVRNILTQREVSLEGYQALKVPRRVNEALWSESCGEGLQRSHGPPAPHQEAQKMTQTGQPHESSLMDSPAGPCGDPVFLRWEHSTPPAPEVLRGQG